MHCLLVSALEDPTAGADASGLATDLSALLQSGDLQAAINRTDPTAIDNTLVRIDVALAKAESLRVPVGFNQSAASRIDLSGLLLDSGLQAGGNTASTISASAYTPLPVTSVGSISGFQAVAAPLVASSAARRRRT